MKKIFHFIISHSIFAALCAAALVIQTFQLLHQNINYYIVAFVFFATICSYNFYWLMCKITYSKHFRVFVFIKKEWVKIILLLMTGIAMLPFLYFSNLNLLNVLPGLLLTILYWLPLMPVRLFKRSGIFKTILLAFTWACVTVYMPLNLSLTDITAAAWFVLIRRFLFMLILCIIFDNRDSAIDKIRGIKSLSTEISVAAIRYIVAVVFLILMAIILWYNYFGITTRQAVALLVSTFAVLFTYFFSTKKRGYYFYYFLVDGMMLFSSVAVYIASI